MSDSRLLAEWFPEFAEHLDKGVKELGMLCQVGS